MEDFCIEKKVYYHDTDCGGVVYYANYLKYLEEARTEYFSSKHISLKELAEKNIWFAVSQIIVNYKSPAKYQDTLKISTRIERVRAASIQFVQKVINDSLLLIEAKTTLVCVDRDFKPRPIPLEVRKPLLAD